MVLSPLARGQLLEMAFTFAVKMQTAVSHLLESRGPSSALLPSAVIFSYFFSLSFQYSFLLTKLYFAAKINWEVRMWPGGLGAVPLVILMAGALACLASPPLSRGSWALVVPTFGEPAEDGSVPWPWSSSQSLTQWPPWEPPNATRSGVGLQFCIAGVRDTFSIACMSTASQVPSHAAVFAQYANVTLSLQADAGIPYRCPAVPASISEGSRGAGPGG